MPVKTTTVSRVLLAALASAGACAALAQSSVQIYGRLNTSLEHQKVGGSTLTGLFNNNSRFGFVGSEDLGGGLKAGFQLESGFESDTGAGTGSTGALQNTMGTAPLKQDGNIAVYIHDQHDPGDVPGAFRNPPGDPLIAQNRQSCLQPMRR
jgi:opacity protein-like surface antigen